MTKIIEYITTITSTSSQNNHRIILIEKNDVDMGITILASMMTHMIQYHDSPTYNTALEYDILDDMDKLTHFVQHTYKSS